MFLSNFFLEQQNNNSVKYLIVFRYSKIFFISYSKFQMWAIVLMFINYGGNDISSLLYFSKLRETLQNSYL